MVMEDPNRTVYVNGEYLAPEDAKISIFDRGLLFADSVYEVMGVMDYRLVDFDAHVARLNRSLGELGIPVPLTYDEIRDIQHELVKRNNVQEGMVYMQVTRGTEERDFVPGPDLTPNVTMFTQGKDLVESKAAKTGLKAWCMPDIRWARRDIKTTALLPQVLAKMGAKNHGAYEAFLVKDGYVTEAGSSNCYIVKADTIITRPLTNDILAGCTRKALLKLAEEKGLTVEERLFTPEEAYDADEAFITAASTLVCGIVELDGKKIGGGQPGPVTRRLREIYVDFVKQTAI